MIKAYLVSAAGYLGSSERKLSIKVAGMSNKSRDASPKSDSVNQQSGQYDLGFAYSFNWDKEEDVREALRVLLCNNETERAMRKTKTYKELHAKKDHAALEAAKIRWLLAINPNTPPPVLDHLTRNAPPSMLERIGEHPRTDTSTLNRLANHENPQVRASVAENMNAPLKTLWRLLRDPNPGVRMRLAEGYNVPFAILKVLIEDENPYVAERAKQTMARLLKEVSDMRTA